MLEGLESIWFKMLIFCFPLKKPYFRLVLKFLMKLQNNPDWKGPEEVALLVQDQLRSVPKGMVQLTIIQLGGWSLYGWHTPLPECYNC